MRPIASKIDVFSGIRNEITSRQGLERLLNIGASVYVVDTGARHIIFHPKIYFVKGIKEARIVIGSANLTIGGLNNNIEASVALDLNLNNPEDRKLVNDIESQFLALPTRYPQNIWKINESVELQNLQTDGRLLDEAETSPPRPVATAKIQSGDIVPRIKLEASFLPGTLRKASRAPKRIKLEKQVVPVQIITNFELVWSSKPLTERDLNIPSGINTNTTGSINLDKGLLSEEIDHRYYFRDVVFANLNWIRKSDTVENSEADFRLLIKSISYGQYRLRIAHTFNNNSRSYKQHNAMTRLSWGQAGKFVRQPNLIGRTFLLYRDKAESTKFVIEID